MTESARVQYTYQQLNSFDQLDVDGLCSLFSLEMSGEAFYNALAERVSNEQAAQLLRRNGREEAGHARRLQRAIAIKLGTDFEPTAAMLDIAPIRVPSELSPEFLKVLIQGELDGDAGYQKWADNEPDPEVARLLRLNGREETIHGERAQEVLSLLQKG
ncbi:MAG: ferritin family protein [Acidimicrobiia bacterium]